MVSELAQHNKSSYRLSFFDKHANVSVKYLPVYQELVNISVQKCIRIYLGWLLPHKLLVVRYFSFITCFNSYMLMPYLYLLIF